MLVTPLPGTLVGAKVFSTLLSLSRLQESLEGTSECLLSGLVGIVGLQRSDLL